MNTMTITEARAVLADDSAGNNATAAALRTLREVGAELPTSCPIAAADESLGGRLYGPDGLDERPWDVEELSEQAVEMDARRQVVPVLAAVAAMWAAFAIGQQAGPQVYRPTATSAKAAAVEAQVLRRAVDDTDPLDPFEGRVSAPAGTPASAVPFVEVAS